MKEISKKFKVLGIIGIFITVVACALMQMPARAVSTPAKINADGQKLYNSATGQTFYPRGANYVRLAQAAQGYAYHSTFEPGQYDPAAAGSFLRQMALYKYNTVRVFIDPGSTDADAPHGIGRGMGTNDLVYGPYMDNFANFVQQAAAHGVYVLPSMDVFPQNSYYWGLAGTLRDTHSYKNVEGRNLSYMERGRIMAKAEYMKQFAAALVDRVGANKNAILAYQADNELYFEANKPPFSALSGTVQPIDGRIYSMDNAADRQQAADASMVLYSHRIKEKLLEADPDALMTIGFFTNRAVGKASYNGLTTAYCSGASCQSNVDYRVPGRPSALSAWGKADFLDIHIYPNNNPYAPANDLATLEEAWFQKPYIIGEFGAYKGVYGSNATTATYAMRDFQMATCKEGAQGWLFWTWDTHENLASQHLFFKMNEEGSFKRELSPLFRPDPCKGGLKAIAVPRYAP